MLETQVGVIAGKDLGRPAWGSGAVFLPTTVQIWARRDPAWIWLGYLALKKSIMSIHVNILTFCTRVQTL